MDFGSLVGESFRKHPILSVTQIVAFLVALPAFFATVSFLNALTPTEAVEKYAQPLPVGWAAGVMNHGQYYHWWTIQQRPFMFAASLLLLTAAVLFIWGSSFCLWRRRGQKAQ
jgi:hypothetical protein